MSEEKGGIPEYKGEESIAPKAAKASTKKPATKQTPSPKPKKEKVDVGRVRVPMHQSSSDSLPKEAKDPDFYYRWCTDYGKGHLARYEAAGYTYVCHEGTTDRIIKPGGHKRYLMKQPMKYRLEDELAKNKKVFDTNAQISESNAPVKGGVVPDYIPDGKSEVVTKDGFS